MPRLEFDATFAGVLVRFGADILRAKGIAHFAGDLEPSMLQYVAGDAIHITPADLAAEVPSGLVVIASKVSPSAVADIFAAHGLGDYLVADDHNGHAH